MSRPASRKGSAKKGAKSPKKVVQELTEENEKLTQDLNALKEANALQEAKLDMLTKKLVSSVDKKEYGLTDPVQPNSVSLELLMSMLNNLIVRKHIQNVSVESRVEELETRVTEMSMELAKLTKKTLAYEVGLEDITKMNSMEKVKDKVYGLQLIAGQAFHSFSADDPATELSFVLNGFDQSPDSPAQKSLLNARKLNLIPPAKKMPGETLVRNMHKDLKLYVIKELSQKRESGADWRMFGTRVGIESDDINALAKQNLECPMGRILSVWEASPCATVRLLHRHLMSPQLRQTLVGKKVSDFYVVD